MRACIVAALVLALGLASSPGPARADLPPGSREELKGLRRVFIDADWVTRHQLATSFASSAPDISVVDRRDDAEIVLRFTSSTTRELRHEHRDVERTVHNPNYDSKDPLSSPTIRVTERETVPVWVSVTRASGKVLRRLPGTTALRPVLSFEREALEPVGGAQLAGAFARWFAKQYRMANAR